MIQELNFFFSLERRRNNIFTSSLQYKSYRTASPLDTMIGNVSWSCLCCKSSGYRKWKSEFWFHGPGAALEVTIIYTLRLFLPAKRRIRIYTLCEECSEIEGLLTKEEQLHYIYQLANDTDVSAVKLGWRRQAWVFYYPISECYKIMANDVQLHIINSAAIRMV